MRILSLGLDKSVLDPNSKTAKRVAEYRNLVEKYIVLVPNNQSKILSFFDLYCRAKDAVEKEKIDLIIVQDPYFIGLLGYFLAKKYGIRLEIQIHGFEKFFGIRKLISKFVISHADSIRVVSQRLKTRLINEFWVKESKITVIPIFVPMPNFFSIEKFKNKDKESRFIFLTVGRLVPVKNIALQIEAFKKISDKYPKAELWIVGDGPEKNNLIKKISDNKLQDRVKLLGYQENVDDFYEQADVFLLTSDSEGWGMVVIEAATYGLPIIMTDVGLAGEIIVNNESGLVVPVGDKRALIQVMIKLIENPDLRLNLAAGAIEAIKKLPAKEDVLKLYKESWQKALK